MNDWIELTEAERRITSWVGEQRFAHARRAGRDPGEGPTKNNETAVNDIRGARCEFAASVGLNLYWRPTIGSIRDKDVGGLVQVRSTVLGDGRLIIKPADNDSDPFVLVVALDERFRLAGWRLASYAKTLTLQTEYGDPAYFVSQHDLLPISSLLAWISEQRVPVEASYAGGYP